MKQFAIWLFKVFGLAPCGGCGRPISRDKQICNDKCYRAFVMSESIGQKVIGNMSFWNRLL